MRFLSEKALNSTKSALKNLSRSKSSKPAPPQCLDIIAFGLPGCECLEKKSKNLKSLDDRVNVYSQSLKMTAAFNNLVSLSAPQIGLNFRFFVMLRSFKGLSNKFFTEKPTFPEQYDTMINPRVLESTAVKEFAWESCKSLPLVKARVQRPIGVKVDYYNERFEVVVKEFVGFQARVFMHEMDHLEGKNIMNLSVNQGDYVLTPEKNEELSANELAYIEKFGKMMDFQNKK